MALSAVTLAGLIKTKCLAAPLTGVTDTPAVDAFFLAIAQAVVEHVTAAGVVTVPAGVPVSGGATSAPAVGAIT